MAEDPNNNTVHSFDGNLNTEVRNYRSKPNAWDYARNANPNSATGDIGDLGSEPANTECNKAPYQIIGNIYLYEDVWAVFSTDEVNSEIGILKQSTCEYSKLVNDTCLNFSSNNLITGAAKRNADCSWSLYFSDNHRNFDRTLNINDVPYKEICGPDPNNASCITCTPLQPLQLDCNKIRLARPTKIPCVQVEKGASNGSLPNGSYMATIAYTVNGQKATDYYGLSNSQSLFSHNNLAGSIDILLSDLDTSYEEFELVIISVVNLQTVAKRIGAYSTRSQRITLAIINNTLTSVPLEFLPLRNPLADSSKSMTDVGDYLIRINPKNKFDFNYQPLANQIVSKWVSVEYPAEYYRKGGNHPSLLRDEVYPFFIEWVYDDGDISSSYHIPGTTVNTGPPVITPYQVNNAQVTSIVPLTLPDGGRQIAEGTMSFWQSTEKYPDNQPTVWGNLCGKPIRHHKMPEQSVGQQLVHYVNFSAFFAEPVIRVLGVKFENIKRPVDNQNKPIMNIVGYRILRGSRDGNRSIIAKGMVNNLLDYDLNDGSGKNGLIPNYPYNSGALDPYLATIKSSTSATTGAIYPPYPQFALGISSFTERFQTFHSPETQFQRPFLGPDYMRIYAVAQGNAQGAFQLPEKHPNYKFITNGLFIMATIGGVGLALIRLNGTRNVKYITPNLDFIDSGTILPSPWAVAGTTNGGSINPLGGTGTFGMNSPTTQTLASAGLTARTAYATAVGILNTANTSGPNSSAGMGSALFPIIPNPYWSALNASNIGVEAIRGTNAHREIEQIPGLLGNQPLALGVLSNFLQASTTFSSFTNEGFDTIVRFIKNANNARPAALQYTSHCFYDDYLTTTFPAVVTNNPITKAEYLGSGFQDFDSSYRINNKYRSKAVITETTTSIPPLANDNTKFTIGTAPILAGTIIDYEDPTGTTVNTRAASYYVGLKLSLLNQYGQLGAVKQIPVGCKQAVVISDEAVQAPFFSEVIFAGDTYITRYAERNTMFFYYDWLYGQPDETEYDYLAYKMLPYPKFWANSTNFDFADFFNSILPSILSANTLSIPTNNRALDNDGYGTSGFGGLFKHGLLLLKNSYFYLFNSGVRDFYVESDINTFQRDWEEGDANRFYDKYEYSDIESLFKVPNIKNLDFYKYDYSLSVTRTYGELLSWAHIQAINYDPTVSETCYVYHKNRLIYSLPQPTELIRDNWRLFLANNYKDFRSEVTTVQNLNQSGAVIFFQTATPLKITGVDTLETLDSRKITIGDGQLFSMPVQNISNADASYEYAACQNARSVINTPAGLYWIAQNQGKIFGLAGGLVELAGEDMKWWFATYLPYQLTAQFPTFELTDNPVNGIGCQSAYDNTNAILYFCKKDYKLLSNYNPNQFSYIGNNDFIYIPLNTPIKLGDPLYFEDCSWTISYEPETKKWISWHDWHPDLLMASKDTFLSIKGSGLWTHNKACNLYCNYYGVDYPFEIDYRKVSGLKVEILNSIEYQLEVYKYADNCYDRFLSAKDNFDEAIIYNKEQVSGLLKLNNTPFNDPQALVGYPVVNANSIDILYSRVETKFRFNQFWDITDDRGQFTTAERMIWNTAGNGYIQTLNPINLNYNKDPLQHKRFRNYSANVRLRKKVCGANLFLMVLSVDKNTLSIR